MRIILGIIAFTLTFGLSASLVGLLFGFPQPDTNSFSAKSKYTTVHTNNIQRLLSRDVSNGDIRDHAYYRLYKGEGSFEALHKNAEYAEAVITYYKKSSNLSDSYLPEDFKYAWRDHMDAWKLQTTYLKSLQNNDGSTRFYADNTSEINRTWFQVLRIAKRYDVQIPSSYYR